MGAVTPRAAAAGRGSVPAVRGLVTDARPAVIASKNVSAPHCDPAPAGGSAVTPGGRGAFRKLKRCQQVASEIGGLAVASTLV